MVSETQPGFTIKYNNHEIKFMNVYQLRFFTEMLEFETVWREIMEIVGNGFDQLDDLDQTKVHLKK